MSDRVVPLQIMKPSKCWRLLDNDLITALQRKAGAGRPPPDVTAMSTPKALRLAVVKTVDDVLGMAAYVTSVTETLTSVARLPDELPDHALMALLEGPERARGLCVFGLSVTASVVEFSTTGQVRKHSPEPRAPTATDAVLCFGLMDRLLTSFEEIVAGAADPPDVGGFSTSVQLLETRTIAVAFDDVQYRMFRIELDMNRGARLGELYLVYPAARPKPKTVSGEAVDWEQALQSKVYKAEASLDAELHRLSLPLRDVADLEVGMQIPIPRTALSRVKLVADGRTVSHARLGQMNGNRAVRIALAISDDDSAMDGILGAPLANTSHDFGVPSAPVFGAEHGGDFDPAAVDAMPFDPPASSAADDFPPMGDLPVID